jgi:short-subunit dehydrogenase involved in D-alanine esterification of teichoic acids
MNYINSKTSLTTTSTGIELMMTKNFAENGTAKVYIVGRRKPKLEEAAFSQHCSNSRRCDFQGIIDEGCGASGKGDW